MTHLSSLQGLWLNWTVLTARGNILVIVGSGSAQALVLQGLVRISWPMQFLPAFLGGTHYLC
jgi:hypothetical protein